MQTTPVHSSPCGGEACKQRMKRLEHYLVTLPRTCYVVVHSTRGAVCKQDAIKAYSETAHSDALLLHVRNLAVLAEHLAPMSFKLLTGLLGTAITIAGAPTLAPAAANRTSLLIFSMIKTAGTLLQCQQEVGERCCVKVAEYAKKAEMYVR